MIEILGNCQMQFVHDAPPLAGQARTFRQLASPLTWLRSPGRVPEELAGLISAHGLEDFLHGRSLDDQFLIPAQSPRLAVFNLFHENEPLFAHQTGHWVFFMDVLTLQASAEFKAWAESACAFIRPNPATYLKRFYEMLKLYRARHAATPMLIVTRLTPRPAFGPAPVSYLRAWEDFHAEATALLPDIAEDVGGCAVLDLERVLAGMWNTGEKDFAAYCPFLRLGKEGGEDIAPGLSARRDLEHIAGVWSRVAAHILEFRENGRIVYAPEESIPPAWDAPAPASTLSGDDLDRLLSSGANYHFGRALGHLLTHADEDHTARLARHAAATPVCENSLHMVLHYAGLRPGPDLAAWCAGHRPTAEAFTAFGAEFRRRYLERLDHIAGLCAGRDHEP